MIFRRKETATAELPQPVTGCPDSHWGVSSHALRTPDVIALTCGEKKLSYSNLDARSSRLAYAMHRLGVREGDRVISLLPTGSELFEVSVAVAKVDAMFVPLSPAFRPDHLATAVNDISPTLVVAGDGNWSELCSRSIELESIKAMLTVDPDGPRHCHFIPGVREEYESSLSAAGVRIEPWTARRGARLAIYHPSASPVESGGLHVVLGDPESVERAHQRHIEQWGWTSSEVYLLCGGAQHPGPGGWAQTAFHVGARVVLMPGWDPVTWLATVEAEHVTRCFMNPRHFKSLLDVPSEVWGRYDLSTLELVVHGGSRCPAAVKMRIIERLSPAEVWEIFGTVDTFVSRISSTEWLERPGSVGRPEPDVLVTVADSDGRSMPEGRTGMICWGTGSRRRLTTPPGERVPATSWSAYVGHLDEEGYLFVTDRSPDGIRRASGTVYPWEVEEVMHGRRGVDDCVVFGVGNMGGRQKIVAVVQASGALTVEEVETHCRLYLSQEKCPDEIVLVDSIGRDEVGKVSRVALAVAHQHGSGIFAAGGDGGESEGSWHGSMVSARSEMDRGLDAGVIGGPVADPDGAAVVD